MLIVIHPNPFSAFLPHFLPLCVPFLEIVHYAKCTVTSPAPSHPRHVRLKWLCHLEIHFREPEPRAIFLPCSWENGPSLPKEKVGVKAHTPQGRKPVWTLSIATSILSKAPEVFMKPWTSLVVHGSRTHMPMQEMWVWSYVWEDPTGHRAAEPVHHNLLSLCSRALVSQLLKPECLDPVITLEEKPLYWEAQALLKV